MDFTGTNYTTPEERCYEQVTVNYFQVIFCPNCGAMNRISLDWCGSIQGLIFCDKCGKEIG